MRSLEPARMWSRVDKTGDCWVWTGATVHNGYGTISVNNRLVRTHRLAYELTHGPIPAGMKVLHTCDNPPCCRPDHLFLGTDKDNVHDAVDKGRHVVPRVSPAADPPSMHVRVGGLGSPSPRLPREAG